MRVDNDGEGGIIALMTLLGVKKGHRPIIIAVGLFGAALIYGDGAITPAISVLSALEGVEQIAPALQTYVLPASAVILLVLFAVQPFGTAAIGRAFGPIMLALVRRHRGARRLWDPPASAGLHRDRSALWPDVPVAGRLHRLPRARRRVSLRDGRRGALCRHGPFRSAADPARVEPVVFPALILNYAGQAAIVLAGAPTEGNIFYRLCPQPLLTPLIVLATVATVIASQSIITGAYSMTRQAIQLGWLPRMTHYADVGGGLRADLCRRGQLAADDRHARADDRLRQVRQSRRRLRHRGFGDDADDERAAVHRHARDLELAGLARRARSRPASS